MSPAWKTPCWACAAATLADQPTLLAAMGAGRPRHGRIRRGRIRPWKTANWWEDGNEHGGGTARPGRAQADDTRSARADVRVRVPDRDHADHRRRLRHHAGPGVRFRQPRTLVRGVLPHRGDRRDRARDAAGPPGVLP